MHIFSIKQDVREQSKGGAASADGACEKQSLKCESEEKTQAQSSVLQSKGFKQAEAIH